MYGVTIPKYDMIITEYSVAIPKYGKDGVKMY